MIPGCFQLGGPWKRDNGTGAKMDGGSSSLEPACPEERGDGWADGKGSSRKFVAQQAVPKIVGAVDEENISRSKALLSLRDQPFCLGPSVGEQQHTEPVRGKADFKRRFWGLSDS